MYKTYNIINKLLIMLRHRMIMPLSISKISRVKTVQILIYIKILLLILINTLYWIQPT